MPQSAYLLLLLAYDEPSPKNSHTVLRSDVSFGYIPRRWIDALDDKVCNVNLSVPWSNAVQMDASTEAHISNPLKGTIHLLGARQQILGMWRRPDLAPSHLT
jgi:hypothetical protein